MSEAMVHEVRRFNRTVTERVGALNDRFLERGRPLGEARLLWEIGLDGCEVRLLRARLGLDSGYLSRLLRSLEAAGLVTVTASDGDRRIRVAHLSAAGRAERAVLDERSDELARSLLAPLSSQQRERLVAAMRDVERLLTSASVEITAVDPEHRDARYCLAEYVAELDRRSDRGFDPSVGATALPHEVRPPAASTRAPRGVRAREWRARRTHRNERRPHRGARPLPLNRLGRGPAVQRRAVRGPLVRESARLALLRRRSAPRAGRGVPHQNVSIDLQLSGQRGVSPFPPVASPWATWLRPDLGWLRMRPIGPSRPSVLAWVARSHLTQDGCALPTGSARTWLTQPRAPPGNSRRMDYPTKSDGGGGSVLVGGAHRLGGAQPVDHP